MKQGRSLKQVKAEQAAKKKKARIRKMTLVLMAEVLVLFVFLGMGYVLAKYGKLQLNPFDKSDLSRNEGVEEDDYTTIALFGGDSREGQLDAGTHADTIILLSIHPQTKEMRMVSVYRDLLMQQKNGKFQKANYAYFARGPKEAIEVLNRNFDLDIDGYVTVDFKALTKVIDLLGGVEVDVTETEASEINQYLQESANVVGKEASYVKAGKQTLNGVEALTYVRIRKHVGEDYGRTARQREVIQKLFKKVKRADLSTVNSMMNDVFKGISTNFTLKAMLDLVADVMKCDLKENGGFAFEYAESTVDSVGSVIVPLGLVENVQELHQFLYPLNEYQVTETVQAIAKELETLTGYTREGYQEK